MRLVAYCRVSTDHDDQLDSLKNQKEFFEEYAKRCGHELIRIYADEGISGKQLKRRQQFLQMMHDAELGMFDVVAVKDVARFARNTVDLLTSIRELKRKNIATEFVTNNMTSLGDSEFVLTLFAAIAQEESANISKRVRFGKKINAEKGRVPNRVYGYRHKDIFTLEIVEEEAAVVRRIFDLVLQGKGFRRISQILNNEQIPAKLGGVWAERSIRRMVQYPIYMGVVVNNRTETDNFLDGTRSTLPQEQWFVHQRPEYAIVSKETFEAVQREIERRKKVHAYDLACHAERRPSSRHLFSGLIVCGVCGASFSRKISKRKNDVRKFWRCYHYDQNKASLTGPMKGKVCRNNLSLDEPALKDCIEQYFRSIIEDKNGFIASVLEKCNQNSDDAQRSLSSEISNLRTQIERQKSRKSKIMDLYAIDALTIDEVKIEMDRINETIKNVEAELSQKEKASTEYKSPAEKAEKVAKLLEGCLSLDLLTNADLKEIIEKIVVYPDRRVEIKIRDLPIETDLMVSDVRMKKI